MVSHLVEKMKRRLPQYDAANVSCKCAKNEEMWFLSVERRPSCLDSNSVDCCFLSASSFELQTVDGVHCFVNRCYTGVEALPGSTQVQCM